MPPKKKKLPSSQIFAIAAKQLIENLPRGEQKRIADHIGVRPGYVNDLINGRKNWSDRTRDLLADYLGLSLADIYIIGENYINTGTVFRYFRHIQEFPPSSLERAEKLVVLAFEELRIKAGDLVNTECLSSLKDKVKPIKQYLDAEIDDAEFFDKAKQSISEMLAYYL